MKKDKANKPVSIEEDLSFDEAMRRIANAPKDEVENAVQEDEERTAKRLEKEEKQKKRQP